MLSTCSSNGAYKGMTTRDIADAMQELYEVEVSHDLISQVTESVQSEVVAWRSRPLEEVYPVLFMDGLVVSIRSEGKIVKHTIYLALAINLEGKKELLGLWISKTEGAKFWLSVLTDLKNRGVNDIFIACVDGLTGFPDAIQSVFPRTQVQLCIVHLVRNSLNFVSYKDRKEIAKQLKAVYRAPTLEAAEDALDEFAQSWDDKYPMISKSWRNHWPNITTMFEYPPEIRKGIENGLRLCHGFGIGVTTDMIPPPPFGVQCVPHVRDCGIAVNVGRASDVGTGRFGFLVECRGEFDYGSPIGRACRNATNG